MVEEGGMESTLDKIEKLIVDGNKGVVERVEKRLEEVKLELRTEMKTIESNLSGQIRIAHSSLKDEIAVTALAVKETVKEETKRVEDKLDKHIRQPAHA